MDQNSSMTTERAAGAAAISTIAIAIGTKHGVVVSEGIWDIGADFGHVYAHRLDLNTPTNTVRLYFSDLDLRALDNKSRKERVEDRLSRAIAQLVVRIPAPMYKAGNQSA